MTTLGQDDVDPLTLDPPGAALYHLTRAAHLMRAVAEAVDQNDGAMSLELLAGVFRQAEVHALIGGGYAALATRPAANPTAPLVVYQNG